jgi:succinate dehydrogenase/fumarate reductase flavoprotein subunit
LSRFASTCCPACGSPIGENANYEWLDAIDVVNMIDACELIVHSSLERKESRGPFFRQDFPADRQCELAGRQCPEEIRQRHEVRAAQV